MALYSNTMAVIRQYLSSSVGDLIYGQAGVTGATTTKIYAPFLWKADDYYNDLYYEVYVYAGTNIGVTKRVTDWVLFTYLLTVHSAYAAACDATSYVELHHKFTTDEYEKAINQAIEFLADKYLLDIVDVAIPLATGIYEYAMPTSTAFEYVHRVTLETIAAGSIFANANIINPDFYDFILVGALSYIKLDEVKYPIVAADNGKDLRIEGQKRQPLLTANTSICYLPLDFIVNKAITYLPQGKIESLQMQATVARAAAFAADVPMKGTYPESKRVLL